MNQLQGYKILTTDDGSCTLFSEAFQEACHSTSGAREETRTHYLEGTKITEKLAMKEHVSILEVGFGTGLGADMTIELVTELKRSCSFLSLEIDEKLVRDYIHRHNANFEVSEIADGKKIDIDVAGSKLSILVGNARSTLRNFLATHPMKFDAIYQDAFSPKRNPVLWTTEWFSLLKQYSSPDVILSTYSASNSIRKSLVQAGWSLKKGEAFGPKRASTRADLSGVSDQEILGQMERSPSTAITDSQLSQELFL